MYAGQHNSEEGREGRGGKDSKYDREFNVAGMVAGSRRDAAMTVTARQARKIKKFMEFWKGTFVLSRLSRKCVTLKKLRTKLKTNFSLFEHLCFLSFSFLFKH